MVHSELIAAIKSLYEDISPLPWTFNILVGFIDRDGNDVMPTNHNLNLFLDGPVLLAQAVAALEENEKQQQRGIQVLPSDFVNSVIVTH